MWKLLCNELLVGSLGKFVWSLIPETWRQWWYPSLSGSCVSTVGVSVEEPVPMFEDVTAALGDTMKILAEKKLSKLMEHYNAHCVCDVRCPWGCTDFLENCGGVAFDKV